MEFKFSDAITINPSEKIKKGELIKKISMQNIKERNRNILDYEIAPYSSGSKFRNKDTLFARITPCLENGKTAQVNILNDDEIAFGSTEFIVFRARTGITIPDYVYFLSISECIRQQAIKSMTGTSGRQRVQNSIFDEITIEVPSIEEQEKIVGILNSLDSKIEINNKIISNLESQAQAIFKSWFVDFEPFQDGDFVESELGMIPEGWEVKELVEVADFSNGYSFKSKDLLEEKKSKNDYKVFKQADIKVGGGINPNNTKSWIDSEFIRKNKLSRFIIQSGDLMMCMTDMKNNVRLLGNTALVYQSDEYILNQRVGRLRSKQKEIKPSFLYYLTNNSVFLNDLRGRANTGVQVNLSTSEIKRSKVVLPTCDIIKRFCDYSESITKSINSLNNQNTKLAELRDALLPKLMAGEIDVSDIKIEGEEVKNE